VNKFEEGMNADFFFAVMHLRKHTGVNDVVMSGMHKNPPKTRAYYIESSDSTITGEPQGKQSVERPVC
jgi:hypothetical protein